MSPMWLAPGSGKSPPWGASTFLIHLCLCRWWEWQLEVGECSLHNESDSYGSSRDSRSTEVGKRWMGDFLWCSVLNLFGRFLLEFEKCEAAFLLWGRIGVWDSPATDKPGGADPRGRQLLGVSGRGSSLTAATLGRGYLFMKWPFKKLWGLNA